MITNLIRAATVPIALAWTLTACSSRTSIDGNDTSDAAPPDGAGDASAWDGALPPNEVHGDVAGITVRATSVSMFNSGSANYPSDVTAELSSRSECGLITLQPDESALYISLVHRFYGPPQDFPETLQVYDTASAANATSARIGKAFFNRATAACALDPSVEAIGGTITVYAYGDGYDISPQTFAASFDLVFPGGDHVTGSFTAYPCPSDGGADASPFCR